MSRRFELEGLIHNLTFRKVREDEINDVSRIFGSIFVDELKVGTTLKKNIRLIAQTSAGEEESYIITRAPTVQRFSQRLSLIISASTP